MRSLPIELRETLLLVVLAGFTHGEAAAALDVPLAAVVERLARARARLSLQIGGGARRGGLLAADGASATRQMTSRADPAETLADLSPMSTIASTRTARRDFEARLGADAELRREVALWQAQNREIRAAFGAPPRDALDLGGVSNENGLAARRPVDAPAGWRAALVRPAQAPRSPTLLASTRRAAAPGAMARRPRRRC